jgi:hypothetical protein
MEECIFLLNAIQKDEEKEEKEREREREEALRSPEREG